MNHVSTSSSGRARNNSERYEIATPAGRAAISAALWRAIKIPPTITGSNFTTERTYRGLASEDETGCCSAEAPVPGQRKNSSRGRVRRAGLDPLSACAITFGESVRTDTRGATLSDRVSTKFDRPQQIQRLGARLLRVIGPKSQS